MIRVPATPSRRKTDVSNPPRSAPTETRRYSTSRLQQLAAPRPSSSWRKPIKSKFQKRNSQFTCSANWDDVANTNKRLTEDQRKIDTELSSLRDRIERKSERWKTEVSPKINRVLSSIRVSPKGDSEMVLGENRQGSSKGDWNDSYSASTDSDEDVDCISSKCNESQHEAVITLKRRVEELSQLVTAKDEEKDVVTKERSPRVGSSESVSSTVSTSKKTSLSDMNTRLSFESIGSTRCTFNDMFRQMSKELDTKLSEINTITLDHEEQIELIHHTSNRSFDSDMLEEDDLVKVKSMTHSRQLLNQSCQKEDEEPAKVDMLVQSLATLKCEHVSLKESLHKELEDFQRTFRQDYNKIMDYVREELASSYEHMPIKELKSYNQALEYELEVTQSENAELKAELLRAKREQEAAATTPQKITQPVFILSPLPTVESWGQFCTRVKEALDGANNQNNQTKKVVLDSTASRRADCFLKELSFDRQGTPLRLQSRVN
eukprot:scaffold12454_cov80-Cyclotella_meneghiniana.AAC.2